MNNHFQDAVAAITGAGSGLGQPLAIQPAAQGCQPALADINQAGLDQTLEKLPSGQGQPAYA